MSKILNEQDKRHILEEVWKANYHKSEDVKEGEKYIEYILLNHKENTAEEFAESIRKELYKILIQNHGTGPFLSGGRYETLLHFALVRLETWKGLDK